MSGCWSSHGALTAVIKAELSSELTWLWELSCNILPGAAGKCTRKVSLSSDYSKYYISNRFSACFSEMERSNAL